MKTLYVAFDSFFASVTEILLALEMKLKHVLPLVNPRKAAVRSRIDCKVSISDRKKRMHLFKLFSFKRDAFLSRQI